MLCGRSLSQQSGKLYKTIAEAKDFNAKKFDAIEQESLPSKIASYYSVMLFYSLCIYLFFYDSTILSKLV